jgi:hypothetical protein
MAKPIPEGLHSVTPALTVKGCAEAIETWKKAQDEFVAKSRK